MVISVATEPAFFVRRLTAEERQQSRADLRSREATFSLRRCEMLSASAAAPGHPHLGSRLPNGAQRPARLRAARARVCLIKKGA